MIKTRFAITGFLIKLQNVIINRVPISRWEGVGLICVFNGIQGTAFGPNKRLGERAFNFASTCVVGLFIEGTVDLLFMTRMTLGDSAYFCASDDIYNSNDKSIIYARIIAK